MKHADSLGVIGLGYVGVPLVNLALRKGFAVVGVDHDAGKIAMLSSPDNADQDLFIRQGKSATVPQLTTDFAALAAVETVVICVPTPISATHQPDLTPLKHACQQLGPQIRAEQLIILESTVNPGVCERVIVPLLNTLSDLQAGTDYFLAHCPERINPGDVRWHVGNIPRVIGGVNRASLDRASEFYAKLLDATIHPMASVREAEAVKIVENSFRDINIAFVNELARSFTELNIDVKSVIDGASTKPFGFMAHYPGLGVGGHCIPVDPYYLIEEAKNSGFDHDFLLLARRINNDMPSYVYNRLVQALNEHALAVKNTVVALLGLSYKPDVADTRQSPAYVIKRLLEKAGARLRTFDPLVPNDSSVPSLEMALQGAQAAILATAHSDFAAIDFANLKRSGLKLVVDGRNFFDKDRVQNAGLTYVGIGR